MGAWLAVIGSFLAIVAGAWAFFARRNSDKRKRLDEASKQFIEGIKERDPSKVVGSADRLRNDI